jgi:hypothetical protein
MKRIHPEFAYQSRELGIQIDDTLGEPPDRKNYARVIKSLIAEYASGSAFDDVNLLSFALVDYLQFDDPAGLLAQCTDYDAANAVNILTLVSCADADACNALTAVSNSDPQLARKAVLTAFLYKNQKRWIDEDTSLEALQKDEDKNNDEDEDQLIPGQNIVHLFDSSGDENV